MNNIEFSKKIINIIPSKDVSDYLNEISFYNVMDIISASVLLSSINVPIKTRKELFEEMLVSYDDKVIQTTNPCFSEWDGLKAKDVIKLYIDAMERQIKYTENLDFSKCVVVSKEYGDSYSKEEFEEMFSDFKENERDEELEFVVYDIELKDDFHFRFNKNLEMMFSSYPNDYPSAFEGIFLRIPLPFKRGDIIRLQDGELIVVKSITTWNEDECVENGMSEEETKWQLRHLYDTSLIKDFTDICVVGFFSNGSQGVYHEVTQGIFDAEIVKNYDELEGYDRFLIAVSNFMKGKIDIDLLGRSLAIINAKEQFKEDRRHYNSDVLEEYLKLAGIGEEYTED